MSQEPLLNVNHIDVFYGGLQALYGVFLTVTPGEIVAIIGANGAGKSTLLDTIAGVIHPSRGTIEFNGENITTLEPFHIVSRGVCLVPEAGRTFANMTVKENLNIGSYNRKARGKKAQNLEMVYQHLPKLKERENQLAKTLSGGERQMLAIGRGLMSDPQLMLFDELSLGLSPIIINELYRVIREIKQRHITVILVEQNVRRSLKEADRAYILETGQIALSGKVTDLCEETKVKQAYFGS